MAHLNSDWITDGMLDFEYKKYVLMAYLQHVDKQFSKNLLHPCLPELQWHFDSCIRLRANKSRIKTSFPKNITGIDLANQQLEYEELHPDDPYLEELNVILDFAIPRFAGSIELGSDRFREVGENIRISPVGVVPLRLEEGYMLFMHAFQPYVSIFEYQLALYNELRERCLKTKYVETVRIGLTNSVSQVKVELTKRNQAMPNPATYVVESRYDYPLHETLLPVAKKLMLREISVA